MRRRPNRHEIIDEAGGFLGIGGAQIEGKVAIGRLALRRCAGKGEKQVGTTILKFLEQGEHPGNGRSSHITEQQKHPIFDHELHGVVDRRIRLIAVIVGLQPKLPAAHAALPVDVLEIRTCAPMQFDAQTSGRPRKRRRHAQQILALAHPGITGGGRFPRSASAKANRITRTPLRWRTPSAVVRQS